MAKSLFICLTIIITLFSIKIINAQTTNTTNDPELPPLTFSLTSLPEPERVAICAQNKGHCASNCGEVNQDAKNFCNETTMGWGCGCLMKTPDYQPHQWPINHAHCINSGVACKKACQTNNYTEEKKSTCATKCVIVYDNTCGTPNQPPAYYMVDDITQVPTYGPPTATTTNSTTNSTDTSSSSSSTNTNQQSNVASSLLESKFGWSISVVAFTALVAVASGMMML